MSVWKRDVDVSERPRRDCLQTEGETLKDANLSEYASSTDFLGLEA